VQGKKSSRGSRGRRVAGGVKKKQYIPFLPPMPPMPPLPPMPPHLSISPSPHLPSQSIIRLKNIIIPYLVLKPGKVDFPSKTLYHCFQF
jgi:hypothetical protein